MRKFLFTLLLGVPAIALAKVPDDLLDMACRKQVESVLTKYGSKDAWFRTVDPSHNVRAYRSPTDEIGKWIEIQTYPNPYVFVYENEQTHVREYEAKTCKPLNVSTVQGLGFSKKKKNAFNDADLKKLADSEKPSIVYVWSPIMTYSVTEMKVFKDVAKEMDINFVPVVYSHLPKKQFDSMVEGLDLGIEIKHVNSLDIYMREGLVHFPSTFVVGHGKVSPRIFGVLTPDTLKQAIGHELGLLVGGGK